MSRDGFIRGSFGDLLESRDERLPNDGTHPLYSLTIKDGVTPKTERYEREFLVTNKENKKYKVIRTGDLVFNPSNLRWGAIATSFIQFPVLASPIYEVFYPRDDQVLDPYFLGALASSPMLMAKYLSLVEGTLVERTALKKDDFLNIEIEIPPLPEQKKIAEILSGLDELISATQRKVERIRTAQEGFANSWQEWGSLETEEGTLGDLIASIDSGWSPACDEVPPKSGEWGVLKVSAVTKGYFCEEESKRLPSDLQPREQFLVKKNDVLITRANGNLDLVGRGAIVEDEPAANLLMSDKILRLNLNSHSDRNFLLLLLNSRHVRQQIETAVGGSTGAKNIGQSLLRQISTPVPTSEDQVRVGNLSRSLSATLSTEKKRLDSLVSLKKGISADLLTGRKRVSV